MKFLQPLDVLAVQRPGLAPTEKRCEKNGTADLELLWTIEYCVELSTLVRSLPSAWLAFADPKCDPSVKRSITGDDAAQYLKLSTFFS